MSNAVREKLEAYFASLNSTSSRMMADIISSREEYRDKWESMPPEEQSNILWRSIVKPDAVTKYKDLPAKSLDVEYFPVLRTRPGEKIIVDEDSASAKSFVSGSTWHDEHSAPFRWETQSQLELRIHDNNETEEEKINTLQREVTTLPECEKQEVKKEEEIKRPTTVKRPEVPPPPVPPHATPPIPPHIESPPVPAHVEKSEKGEIPIYAKVVKRKSSAKTLVISEMKAHRKAMEEMKPAVPPRMSLELKGEVDISKFKVQDIDIDGIPKTGFDFLDNW